MLSYVQKHNLELHEMFKKIDKEGKGYLTIEDLRESSKDFKFEGRALKKIFEEVTKLDNFYFYFIYFK